MNPTPATPNDSSAVNVPDMRIEGDKFIVRDGPLLFRHYTHEGLLMLFREVEDLRETNADLGYEANRNNPSRFLPDLINKLEDAFISAQSKGDNARAEVYAMTSMMVRAYLKKEIRP